MNKPVPSASEYFQGPFPQNQSVWEMKRTIHFNLMQNKTAWSRTLPPYAFTTCNRENFTFISKHLLTTMKVKKKSNPVTGPGVAQRGVEV